MIKEGKFGVSEAVSLSAIAVSSKIFFTSPGYLTRFVGTAGWYMTLISCLIAIIAFSTILILFRLYPGKNIIEIFDLTLGRFFGGLFSLIYAAFFLFSAGTMAREFADVLKIFILPETPFVISVLILILSAVTASMVGLEAIARFAKLIAYFLLISFLFVLLLAFQNYKLTNLYPILGYGIGQTLLHGAKRCSSYDEAMVLLVFAGSLQGTKYLRRAGLYSLLISGGVISLGILCFTLEFPIQTLQELTTPMLFLARAVNYGPFFQRLDPVFIIIWSLSTLVSVTVMFYAAVSCYCKMFRMPDFRPAVLPMGVVLMILCLLPRDFVSVVEGNVQFIREYGWTVFFGFPLISLAVAGIRKLFA